METSRTNAQYKRNVRDNSLYEIEWILWVLWFFFLRQTRQIQQYRNQALKCNHFTILYIQEMIMLIRTKASMNVSFTIDTVSEHLTINKYRSNAKACNVSLHSIYCSSSSSVVCLFWFPLKKNMKQKKINLHSHVFSMHLSNSSIIYEEKITTMKEVWICDPNCHKNWANFFFEFLYELLMLGEAVSNTRKSSNEDMI